MKKRMKRYQEGGDVDSDIEYTTDEEGNEVAISRKNYATGVRASETPTTSRRSAKTAPAAVSKKTETAPAAVSKNTETVTMTPRAASPKTAKALVIGTEEVRGMTDRPRRMGFRREAPSEEQKELNAHRLEGLALMAATGANLRGLHGLYRAKKAADAARKAGIREREHMMGAEAMDGAGRSSGLKKGGAVKKYASGGSVSSASSRADGIAQRGKTKGRVL